MMNQIQTSQKLDFLIVGTQKSGTTALDYFLRQNPSVQMPRNKKELHLLAAFVMHGGALLAIGCVCNAC